MFMDFQQQQEAARQQQQLQVQTLMEKLQSSTVTTNLVQRLSPSSAEKRAERSSQDRLDFAKRQAKLESIKVNKKKCDEEYEIAAKKLEKARRAKKNAEKLLAGASDSDASDSDDMVLKDNVKNLASQFNSSIDSDDSPGSKQRKKAEKKRRQREKKSAAASSVQSSVRSASSLPSAPVPRASKQGKTDDDIDQERVMPCQICRLVYY